MKKITVGILAHVDSGKTTLSEALLFLSGNIRKLGRVDKKDAFLDNFALERQRGITIFSKQAVLKFGDTEITLIDTPGHADFSPEAERTLQILDAAILVISASDSVQSHTETMWKLLSKHNVPVFIFVNKTDLPNNGRPELMADIKRNLSEKCLESELLSDEEELSMCSETIMEKVLGGENVSDSDIADAVMNRQLFPCFFGSALKTDGVEEFLYALDKYIDEPKRKSEFGARVFKITRNERGERLVHMKITGGELNVKEKLKGVTDGEEWEEKVDQIRVYSGEKSDPVQKAEAGTVCTVTGLTKAKCGDGLGFENDGEAPILEPVLSYKVLLPEGVDLYVALADFCTIEEEEPTLRINFDKRNKEIHFLVMGEVQLEVLKFIIKERFNIDVEFGHGNIVYRETIDDTVEGVGHYEPLRHYSEVHLILEPAEPGSGLTFASDCSENDFARNWQRLVLTHLTEKTHLGVLTGSPITDMKITLVAGRAHKKHTEGGDFREATYRAVRHGLRKANSILLEPWYDFEIKLPQENVGRAMSDIDRMGGTFGSPYISGDMSVIKGSAPVSEMRDYMLDITSYTHGKGTVKFSLKGYEPCHNAQEVIASIAYDCDSDLDNTADSVFCAQGAGFLVKWDEVEDYMHIDSILKPLVEEEDEEQIIKKRSEEYVRLAATDSELIKIFERTYGEIKQRRITDTAYSASTKPASKPKPKEIKVRKNLVKTFDEKEYLLVDGYNIIFAWDELKKSASDSLDLARTQLTERLCNYQAFTGVEVILVFDAYKVKKNPGSVEKIHNINVVYTKEAETADSYIERVSAKLSKNHKVRVATSDGPEQLIIFGSGALRIPAAAFHKEVRDTENAISNIVKVKE